MAYRFTENDHECWPTNFGRYRMLPGWIDTDNECWEEPYHLRSADGPRVIADAMLAARKDTPDAD